MGDLDEIRRYWDADAKTYDDSPDHRPVADAERAAWNSALSRLLPPAPARVLDCGAGTGFLSLMAAAMGHKVTAVDLSAGMLARLAGKAVELGLDIDVVEGSAAEPPEGPFDAVMERHVLWTLPDPVKALSRWRQVTPIGRLVLIESVWGDADPVESIRSKLRETMRVIRRDPPDHHASYRPELVDSLPLGRGTAPSQVLMAVGEAGWGFASLERLRDVEWAASQNMGMPDRLLGVAPRFAVCAGER